MSEQTNARMNGSNKNANLLIKIIDYFLFVVCVCVVPFILFYFFDHHHLVILLLRCVENWR